MQLPLTRCSRYVILHMELTPTANLNGEGDTITTKLYGYISEDGYEGYKSKKGEEGVETSPYGPEFKDKACFICQTPIGPETTGERVWVTGQDLNKYACHHHGDRVTRPPTS